MMEKMNKLTIEFECKHGKKPKAILMGALEYLEFWAECEQFCLKGQRQESLAKELRKRKPTKWMGLDILVKDSPGIELAVPPELAPMLAHRQLQLAKL